MKKKMFGLFLTSISLLMFFLVTNLGDVQAAMSQSKSLAELKALSTKDIEIFKAAQRKLNQTGTTPTVEAMKTPAVERKYCIVDLATGGLRCTIIGTECPSGFSLQVFIDADGDGASEGQVTCGYDCSGIYPDSDGNCDCPQAEGQSIFCPQ